ncbi:MAG TPA: sugar ABC transporter ATP-binding protein [Iamia sp.]|nr:sugar ABC transporter ATP-binding protein [Iamia sp.]
MTAGEPPLRLALSGLSKTFGGTRALREVDLGVGAGEIHALVGANGSGKSTLIKVLAGIHEPDPGATAAVSGEPLALGNAAAADAAGIRFVHQDIGVVGDLPALDNFSLGRGYATGRLGRIDWRRQRREAEEALGALGYDFDVRLPASRLGAAERTGIAIARCLRDWEESVSLLVLDEPTASLPKPEVERLFEVVRRVRSMGVSVIYVSHHLDEVFAVADRVSVLRDGRRVATEAVTDLDHDELVELMVGAVDMGTPTPPSDGRGPVRLAVTGLRGRVVEGLDLTVRQGEIVGVAGITGSGREEVASLIFGGTDRHGEVVVDDRTVPPDRPDLSVGAGLGFVPPDRHGEGVVLDLSVLENLTLADLRPYWQKLVFRSSLERTDGQSWLDRLSVTPGRHTRAISTLSGGNQQKVVIGKWLRLAPSVLLLDEPTQGVDVRSKADIHRLVEEAADGGTAVLVCSSDEAELERLCDRVVVLADGRVRTELRPPHLTAAHIAQASLGGSRLPTSAADPGGALLEKPATTREAAAR